MKIDLLPGRYHQVRKLERQIMWGFVALTAVGVILITTFVVVHAQGEAYRRRIAYLNQVAGQYKVVNDSYVSLADAEKNLAARKALLQPLIDRKATVLTVLDGFRREFPSGIQLASVSVPGNGNLEFRGQARSFGDVGRFMKWLSARKGYRQVVLVEVQAAEAGVTFSIRAAQAEGGGEG